MIKVEGLADQHTLQMLRESKTSVYFLLIKFKGEAKLFFSYFTPQKLAKSLQMGQVKHNNIQFGHFYTQPYTFL